MTQVAIGRETGRGKRDTLRTKTTTARAKKELDKRETEERFKPSVELHTD